MSSSTSRFTRLAVVLSLVAAIAVGLAGPAGAATLTWDANGLGAGQPDGGGAWLDANQWWDGVSDNPTWTSGDSAIFGLGGAGGAVTLATPTTVGSLTMNAFTGTYTLGTAGQAITLNSGLTMNLGAGATTIISPITLGGPQAWTNDSTSLLTVSGDVANGGNLLTVSGTGNTAIGGIIGAGAGGLTKSGTGTVTLGNTNTYTGQTTVTLGTLNASATNALGTGAALLVNGGTLDISTFSSTVGAVTLNSGSINGSGGTLTGTSFAVESGSVSAILAGAGATLTKTTAGTVTLSNTNTYTGATTITTGTLQLDGSTDAASTVGIGTAGILTGSGTVNGSATLTGSGIINKSAGTIAGTLGVTGGNWNGAGSVTGLVTSSSGAFTIGSGANLTADGGLAVTGGTIAAGSATGTITGSVNYTSASSSTFQGVIAGGGKTLTLNNASATLTLSGANNYTGATTVSAGLLRINGNQSAATGAVVVSGGAIGGTGTIGGAVTISGTGGIKLADGAVGTLTLGSSLAITGAAGANRLSFDLGSAAAGADKIAMTGAPSVTNNGVAVNFIQIGGNASRINAGTYTIIQGTSAPTLANYALATTKAFGNTYALSVSGNDLQVTTAQAAAGDAAAFWSGATNASWGTLANWKTAISSNITVASAPSYGTAVTFVTTTPIAGNLTTTLDADQDIKSLTLSPLTGGITIGSGASPRMLTIESAGGINSANTSCTNTISANIGFAGSQTLTVGTGGTLAVSGYITDFGGGYSLTKAGSGTLLLTGANTYTGATVISAGTLSIGSIDVAANPNPLGQSPAAAANLLLANGTTLKYTGPAASTDRSFTINVTAAGNGATLDASGSGAINFTSTATPAYGTANQTRTLTLTGSNPGNNTLAALIADNGTGVTSVTKAGIGTWILSGLNTYTGATTTVQSAIPMNNNLIVQFGTLAVTKLADGGSPSSIGMSGNAAANLVINNGTVLKYIGAGDSTDRAFTISGDNNPAQSGTLDASGSGAINWTSTAAITYGNTNQTRTLTLTGSSTADNTLKMLLGDNGTGAVTLAKAGQGTWILNGPVVNTYTGGTNVNTGTLVEDFVNLGTPTNLIKSTTPITFGGGTLSLLAKNNVNSAQTLPNPTFGSQAGSGISVTGRGTGTMTLTLGSTWTRNAGSTVNVTLGAGGTLSSSPAVDASTPTPLVKGSGAIAFATVGGTDWAKVSGGTVIGFVGGDYTDGLPSSGATSTVNYSQTGSAPVTTSETVNTLKLNASTAGKSLTINADQALTINAGGLLFVGANDYSITGGTLKGAGGTGELVVHQFGVGNLTINSALPSTTILTKTGTGTLTLPGANTYAGATYLGGGGTLVLKNRLAVQNSVLSINNSSLVFDSSVAANAFTVGGLSASYAGPGYDVALQNNAGSPAPIALTVGGNNGSGNFFGTLSGAGSLIKVGSGTQTLSGINTYTGGTTVSAGTLACGIARDDWFLGGAPGAVNVTVQNGATLALNRNTMAGTLTLNGGIVFTSNGFGSSWDGSVILGAGTTSIISGTAGGIDILGAISGSGRLARIGTSSTILAGYNTYTGGTFVYGGTLTLNGTIGGGGGGGTAITSLATFTEGATGVIAGTSSLTVYAGTTSLAGANTYTGNTTLMGGTTTLVAAETANVSGPLGKQPASAAGTIVLGGGFLKYSATNQFDYSGRFSTAANQAYSVDTNGQAVTWASGLTSSGGALTKIGLGALTLSGTNTYAGGTTVNAGSIQFNTAGSIAGAGRNITVNGPGAVSLGYTPAGSIQTDLLSRIVSTSTGAVAISGAISESFDFSSGGPGNNFTALSLGAIGSATYTGTLKPNGTTYRLGGGGGTLIFTPATFLDANDLVVNGNGLTGTVDFGGAGRTFGAVTIGGGTVTVQNGTLTGTSFEVQGGTVSAVLDGATAGLTKTGAGTATLNGAAANTYTGATTVNRGTLIVDFANMTAPTNLVDSNSALVMGGGTLQVKQKSATVTSQTFNGTTINAGGSTIQATNTGGSATLTLTAALGALARNAGGVVNFTLPTATQGNITTSTANDATGFLGRWATTGLTTSLQYAANDGSNNIIAYTGATAATAGTLANMTSATTNYSFAAAATIPNGSALTGNTLRYTGAAATLEIGSVASNTNTLRLNGLMNAGSGALTVQRTGTGATGGLVVGDSNELVIVTNAQGVTISAPIQDNSNGPGAVTFASYGGGALTLSSVNTYSGGTTVASGKLVLANLTDMLGTGPVTLMPGSSIDLNAAKLSNSFTITDASLVQGNSFNSALSGPITISGVFTIGFTGEGNSAISSNISGSGGLTANCLRLDSLTYLSGTNTYAGPTTIGAGGIAGALKFTNRVSLYNGDTGSWTADMIIVNPGAVAVFAVGGAGQFTSSDITTLAALGTTTGGFMNGSFIGLDTTTANYACESVIGNPNGGANKLSVHKFGVNTLTLSGASTYTGQTRIYRGALSVSSINSVVGGTASSNMGAPKTVDDGTIIMGLYGQAGTLIYTGNGETTDRVIAVNNAGGGGGGGGATIDQSGTTGLLKFTSDLSVGTLTGKNITFQGSTGGMGEFAGMIPAGVNNVVKSGTGTWTLSGANLYSGTTTINGGVLVLNNAAAIPGGIGTAGGTSNLSFNGGVIGLGAGNFTRPLDVTTIAAAATFTGNGGWAAYGADRVVNIGGDLRAITWATANTGLNGRTLILGAATATHTVDLQNPLDLGAAVRTVQVDDGAAAVDGKLSGVLSGAGGGLTKTGAGTLVLSGDNTYTGATTVSAGRLYVNGTHTTSTNNAYSVTGTLGGGGTITTVGGAVTVNSGGKLAPGTEAAPGTMTMNLGNAALSLAGTMANDAGEFTFRLGAVSDKIVLGADTYLALGTATENNLSLDWSDFTFIPGPGLADGVYTLIDAGTNATGGLSTGAGILTGPIGIGTGTLSISGGQDLILTVTGFVIPGDTNGDRVVDAADFITLKKNFGTSTGAGVAAGDFNSSGTVNWADLGILMNTMGTGGGAPATAPEPATLGLLAIGALAMLRRNRRS